MPFSGKARDTFVRFRALHNKRLVEMSTPEQAGGFACGLDAGVLEHGRSKGQVKTPEQPPPTPGQDAMLATSAWPLRLRRGAVDAAGGGSEPLALLQRL